MHPRALTVRFCFWLLIALVAAGGARAQEEDPETAYARLWMQAAAGVMAISARTTLDPDKPDATRVRELQQATDRLENAVSGMLKVLPRGEEQRAHAIMVPRLLEVVGAAREVLHSIEIRDRAKVAADLDWLDEAIAQVRTALARANRQ